MAKNENEYFRYINAELGELEREDTYRIKKVKDVMKNKSEEGKTDVGSRQYKVK